MDLQVFVVDSGIPNSTIQNTIRSLHSLHRLAYSKHFQYPNPKTGGLEPKALIEASKMQGRFI